MATATATMPIEQYLRTSYSPDADFVDGVVEERTLGEYEHGRLTGLLFSFFYSQEKALDIKAVVEQRIRVNADRVRVCDFVLLRASSPREQVVKTAPLLCVEVLSPEDRLPRAKVVLEDYVRMGVPSIWLLDPLRRVAYTFDENGLHEQEGQLTLQPLSLSIDIEKMFEELD